jgi:pimeloyl-ACP methyl ester carboxylesterase
LNSITHHPEQLIAANSIDINYDSFGDKSHPAIVLIMGLATQMIYWDQQFCELLASQGYWVIRFDNRDNGKSTWLDSTPAPTSFALLKNAVFRRPLGATYLLSDMMKDTLGLLDALHLKSAHIVGVSMGGMIAQEMANLAGEQISRLICYGTGPVGNIPGRFETINESKKQLKNVAIYQIHQN